MLKNSLLLSYAVTQSFGSCNPEIISLEVHTQYIVVGRRCIDGDIGDAAVDVAHVHLRRASLETRPIDGPVSSVVVGETLVGAEPGAIGVERFYLVGEIAGQAAVFSQEVVPVAAVVAAVAKVSRHPQNAIDVADRRGDLVDQSLVLEQNDLGLAVRIVVVLPAFALDVVFEHATTPYGVVDLVWTNCDGIRPDLIHRRIALVEEAPLTGAGVVAAGACCCGRPDIVTLHGDAVYDVVAES